MGFEIINLYLIHNHFISVPSINSHHKISFVDTLSFANESVSNFFSLQALNGFLMILTCEGEVFFATHSIESYLGFHQVGFGLVLFTCTIIELTVRRMCLTFKVYNSVFLQRYAPSKEMSQLPAGKVIKQPSMHAQVFRPHIQNAYSNIENSTIRQLKLQYLT